MITEFKVEYVPNIIPHQNAICIYALENNGPGANCCFVLPRNPEGLCISFQAALNELVNHYHAPKEVLDESVSERETQCETA